MLTGDIKKLNEVGIHTASALMQTSKRKLAQIKGLSEAKCEKIYEAGEKIAPVSAWQSGKFLLEHRQANLFRLTTGCADFDKMLGGGIETKSITEVRPHAPTCHQHVQLRSYTCWPLKPALSPPRPWHRSASLYCTTCSEPLWRQVFGEYRVGKSQLCLTLAVTAQLPEEIGGIFSRSRAGSQGLYCGAPLARPRHLCSEPPARWRAAALH